MSEKGADKIVYLPEVPTTLDSPCKSITLWFLHFLEPTNYYFFRLQPANIPVKLPNFPKKEFIIICQIKWPHSVQMLALPVAFNIIYCVPPCWSYFQPSFSF